MSYFPEMKPADQLRFEVSATLEAKRKARIDSAIRHIKISMQNAVTAGKMNCEALINADAWESMEQAIAEFTGICEELMAKGYDVKFTPNFRKATPGRLNERGHAAAHKVEVSW